MSVKILSQGCGTALARRAPLCALALVVCLLTALTGSASAAEVNPVPKFSWWGYIQAILIMGLLLLLLAGGAWLLRRSGRFAGVPRGSLPKDGLFVEGQLKLAPRKGLVVVRFLNKRLVLGVTEQQICLITETELHDEQAPFNECFNEARKDSQD